MDLNHGLLKYYQAWVFLEKISFYLALLNNSGFYGKMLGAHNVLYFVAQFYDKEKKSCGLIIVIVRKYLSIPNNLFVTFENK